jgi:uncharacterized protein YciI
MLSEGPTPEEAAIVSEHFNYLAKLTENGVVLMALRTLTTDETTFGIVLLQPSDEAAAKTIMANDPAVRKGVMYAEFFPCRIALMADQPQLIG